MIERLRGLLLGRTRSVMTLAGGVAAVLVISSALLDEGEVVRLTITDETGRGHGTDLWIVDLGGQSYLRASQPDARWLARLDDNPHVLLTRNGTENAWLAFRQKDEALRDRVSRAMAEKYGLADRVWSGISDRTMAVAIRLQPDPERERGEFVGNARNSH